MTDSGAGALGAKLGEGIAELLKRLTSPLHVLDLSFLISGVVATGALVSLLRNYNVDPKELVPDIPIVLTATITAYILGVVAFAVGRLLRRRLPLQAKKTRADPARFRRLLSLHGFAAPVPGQDGPYRLPTDYLERFNWPEEDEPGENANAEQDANAEQNAEAERLKEQQSALYVRMWAYLRESAESGRGNASYEHIQRYWVLSATLDGIAAALVLWTIALCVPLWIPGDRTVPPPSLADASQPSAVTNDADELPSHNPTPVDALADHTVVGFGMGFGMMGSSVAAQSAEHDQEHPDPALGENNQPVGEEFAQDAPAGQPPEAQDADRCEVLSPDFAESLGLTLLFAVVLLSLAGVCSHRAGEYEDVQVDEIVATIRQLMENNAADDARVEEQVAKIKQDQATQDLNQASEQLVQTRKSCADATNELAKTRKDLAAATNKLDAIRTQIEARQQRSKLKTHWRSRPV